MTATDKPARRSSSAEEKAREALGVAERKVKRLTDQRAKADEKEQALHDAYEAKAAPLRVTSDQLADEIDEAAREVEAYRALVKSLAPAPTLSARIGGISVSP